MVRSLWLIPAVLGCLVAACGSDRASGDVPPASGSSGSSTSSAAATMAQGGSSGSASTASAGSAAGGSSSGVGGAIGGGGSSDGAGTAGNPASSGAAGNGDAGLDPARVPGQNFDLTHWALQLPIANGDSVVQIQDLSSYTSEYFFTGPDGAMTFWCPVTGATTPNTHYPRTELRELPIGGDWDISGQHRLTAQLKMLQNPPSKGTVIGQVHGNATGGTSEVLKLEWLSDNQIVASVEANDNPAQQLNHPMGKYQLGELLTYTAELKDSILSVSVTNDAGTQTFTTPYTAASWKNDKYYFKLGAYVQLNAGTAQQGSRVAFYSVAVEHAP